MGSFQGVGRVVSVSLGQQSWLAIRPAFGRFHLRHSSERIVCVVDGFFSRTSLAMPAENLGLDLPMTGLSYSALLWIVANGTFPDAQG
jgi:hypothetical protein